MEAWWTGREGSRVPLGRWCGAATPGPLQSPRGALGLLIALHTDYESVASGFKARYVFEVSITLRSLRGHKLYLIHSRIVTFSRRSIDTFHFSGDYSNRSEIFYYLMTTSQYSLTIKLKLKTIITNYSLHIRLRHIEVRVLHRQP